MAARFDLLPREGGGTIARVTLRAGDVTRGDRVSGPVLVCHREQEHAGHRGDALAASREAEPLGRRRLHRHATDRAAQVGGDVRAHRRDVRREPRRLRDHRRVDVADAIALFDASATTCAQEVAAVRALPARVAVREMRAEVAQRERAEDRVGDRMQQHVGIGVAEQARGRGES